jgi:hypothetical protein
MVSASLSAFMSRAAILAIVAGAVLATSDDAFAFGRGGGMGGHPGPVTTGVAPGVSHGPTGPGGGPAHPLLKSLSGRGVVKCIRACMHGVDASWAGFCEYSCAGP